MGGDLFLASDMDWGCSKVNFTRGLLLIYPEALLRENEEGCRQIDEIGTL